MLYPIYKSNLIVVIAAGGSSVSATRSGFARAVASRSEKTRLLDVYDLEN